MREVGISDGFDDLPVEDDYRPLSKMALASMLLSLLGFVAWIAPPAWIVPGVSLLLGVASLIAIRRRDYAGEKMALIGCMLSLFFLTAAPTQFLVQRATVIKTARKHAESWLTMVQDGKLMEAHQLTLPYFNRRVAHQPIDDFYREASGGPAQQAMMAEVMSPMEQLNQMFNTGAAGDLAHFGSEATWNFQKMIRFERRTGGVQVVSLLYELELPNQPAPKDMIIQLEREFEYESGGGHWRVAEIFDIHSW